MPLHSVLLWALLALGASSQDPVEGLLERARLALGPSGWAGAGLEGRGAAHSLGLDGRVRVVLGTRGAYRFEIDSALPTAFGFDGQQAWLRDFTGVTRAAELEEADQARLFLLVLSGDWARAGELEVEEDALPGALSLALRGTPMRMRLELDPQRALPRRLLHQGDGGTEEWVFDDYRDVGGRALAHAWTFDEGAGVERFRIESWNALAAEPPFRVEPGLPDDFEFDPEVDPELRVVRAPSGHLVVEARLEDVDLGAFLFDTGAGATVIDKGVADELGLDSVGLTIGVGVAGVTTSPFRRGASLRLGPLTLHDPVYAELDLGFLRPHFERKIAGILGYDVLARCVVELEPATPRIALHPADGRNTDDGPWSDLVLHQNHTCVRARFEGEREGLFRLDTGAGGTVTFHAPAVDALGLLEGRELRASSSGGVGGRAEAFSGRLAWFELGGHRFEAPEVEFSRAVQGAFVDPYTTGNLGQRFLAPFRIVLDYPHDRLRLIELAPSGG